VQRKNLLRKIGLPRTPLPFGGVNVNFCKNPLCGNFGVPAQSEHGKTGRGNVSADGYIVAGGGEGKGGTRIPMLHCKKCGENPTLKSNEGICLEYGRITAYLSSSSAGNIFSCPAKDCPNHEQRTELSKTQEGKVFVVDTAHYVLYGFTGQGARRIQCRACGKVFSPRPATSISRQRKSHLNKTLFALLMNKSPIRRICEVLSLSPSTVYRKMDFIHGQCMLFVAEREKQWIERGCRRVYVSVDRQDYTVNWSERKDKRNVVLSAVGSADNETGYVFGMHLNFDPEENPDVVNSDALVSGDTLLPFPFRKYARLWLDCDYEESVRRSVANKNRVDESDGLSSRTENRHADTIHEDGTEVSETQNSCRKLPAHGMQVHLEYTLYAHFFFLRRFFGNVDKVRFFLDRDSGMSAGAMGAFHDRVRNRTCDAFHVRINKEMTVDERKAWFRAARDAIRGKLAEHPEWKAADARTELMKEAIRNGISMEKPKDRWVFSPLSGMDEPEKAVFYLTDYGDYDENHLADLYAKASLGGIDRFFMQVRRRISLLERPIGTPSNRGRTWYGYSAYNPSVIVKLLDMFRVFYNYTRPGKDGITPAMRIGTARGVVGLDDILYHF